MLWTCALLLSSCVSVPSLQQRHLTADELVAYNQWEAKTITTPQFDLVTYQPVHHSKEAVLTVYIEGDGLAWITKKTISADPTPINPIGLKLALNHPQGNAVYLARPCQYTGGTVARNCTKHDWTDGRFSAQSIESSNQAINTIKAKFGANQLQLVGYSGGGAIAVLLAAKRNDVIKLVTVAGNLDHKAWTEHHNISPLSSSLNPVDYWSQLTQIEQRHFVGGKDTITPAFLAQQFVTGPGLQSKAELIIVPEFNHHCCWDLSWSEMVAGFL